MKKYKKVMICLSICFIFSAASSFFYCYDEFSIFDSSIKAFAADGNQEEKDDSKKAEASKDNDTTAEEPCPECPDPAKVVLRGLEAKKTMIEKQSKALAQEKKELEIFEEQIDEKLENLKSLKQQIENDMALLQKKKTQKTIEKEAAYETKIGRLVKMYAGMKPKNAAQIVDKMNLEVAQEIFLRMREASASQILSFVDSEKAAKISERLAFKRK